MPVEQQPQTETNQSAAGTAAANPTPPVRTGVALRGLLVLFLLGGLVVAAVVVYGITSRSRAEKALTTQTDQMAVLAVSVVNPKVTPGAQEIALPGNMQAFIDTPVWARTSGYLRAWNVDIGGRVKQGQLLALIESPEVDQQLTQAQSQVQTAQANLKLSQVTADRYTELFKTDSVAKQDVDNAVQGQAARKADVASAEANVSRLQQLVGFERVEAPYSGVVTARNTDVGDLVNAGANTPGKELFHIASIDVLRVYVSVPEMYSQAAKPGVQGYLTLDEFPGRKFYGKVVRNANAIDQSSRTLLVEVDVKNPTGELLPGSFVSVHLKLPSDIPAVTVPSNTLLFRSEGLRIVRVQDNKVHLVPVIMGRDFGDTVEIVSGIKPGDQIVVNPSDSIVENQEVSVTASGKQVE